MVPEEIKEKTLRKLLLSYEGGDLWTRSCVTARVWFSPDNLEIQMEAQIKMKIGTLINEIDIEAQIK